MPIGPGPLPWRLLDVERQGPLHSRLDVVVRPVGDGGQHIGHPHLEAIEDGIAGRPREPLGPLVDVPEADADQLGPVKSWPVKSLCSRSGSAASSARGPGLLVVWFGLAARTPVTVHTFDTEWLRSMPRVSGLGVSSARTDGFRSVGRTLRTGTCRAHDAPRSDSGCRIDGVPCGDGLDHLSRSARGAHERSGVRSPNLRPDGRLAQPIDASLCLRTTR